MKISKAFSRIELEEENSDIEEETDEMTADEAKVVCLIKVPNKLTTII